MMDPLACVTMKNVAICDNSNKLQIVVTFDFFERSGAEPNGLANLDEYTIHIRQPLKVKD